jgi:Flp pilus assembly protein TadG
MKPFSCRNGVAMIEFAFVLPVLMVLAFGIIEFGLLMYNQQVITNASREGARAGIVQASPLPRPDPTYITGVVNAYCASRLVTFGGTGTPMTDTLGTAPCAAFGNNLTVSVTYSYQWLVISHFVPGLGTTKTLSARTVMRCE